MMKSVLRLLILLICSFFAIAGLAIFFIYGEKGFEFVDLPGGARFGAAAFWCFSLMGLIFTTVFGYLVVRIITPLLALAQAGCFLMVATAGYLVNGQYEVESHTLFYNPTNHEVLKLSDMQISLTELNARGAESAARILIKDGKGEHSQIMTLGETITESGWRIIYFGTCKEAITLECLYQPGSFWLKAGNIGTILSIVACFLTMFLRRMPQTKPQQEDVTNQEN